MTDTTIIEAMQHPKLFRTWFSDHDSWAAWRSFLAAMFALPMTSNEREIYRRCTGRDTPPAIEGKESWLIVGRRGGKSLVLALIATYIAVFREHEWRPRLVPGERAVILILATDRTQAGVIFGYIRSMFRDVPAMKGYVIREDSETIELKNGLSIVVQTATFRAVRGFTVIAALLDEAAYWREESANPDAEILAAIRPAMTTIPNAKLLVASSPYAKKGILYQAYRDHYGVDGDPILIWKADTKTMHPTVDQAILDEAYERDPQSADAEYGGNFRSDIEAFVSREVLDAVVCLGRYELPPVTTRNFGYVAFCDPSGGSSDSMTLAIAHRDGEVGVLDAVREAKPPFSPESVVMDFAALLKSYGIHEVEGDRYAGEWPRERFREHGIVYEPSAKPKSDIYREMLPLLNSGKAELLEHKKLFSQLATLERRTARGGRDSVDHPPGAHDDVANSVAGALVRAVGQMDKMTVWLKCGGFAV